MPAAAYLVVLVAGAALVCALATRTFTRRVLS
jgi:hypothetical protein